MSDLVGVPKNEPEFYQPQRKLKVDDYTGFWNAMDDDDNNSD